MKRYNVGPRWIYPNGDTGPMSLPGFPEMFIDAKNPAEARKIYIEKTGYSQKVSSQFIINCNWIKA